MGLPYPGGLGAGAAGAEAAIADPLSPCPAPCLYRDGCDLSSPGLKTAAARMADGPWTPSTGADSGGFRASAPSPASWWSEAARRWSLYAGRHGYTGSAFRRCRRGGRQWRRREGPTAAAPPTTASKHTAPSLAYCNRHRSHDRPGRRRAAGAGGSPTGWMRWPGHAGRRTRRRPWPTSTHVAYRGGEPRHDGPFHRTVGVIGAGAWGIALAQTCVARGAGRAACGRGSRRWPRPSMPSIATRSFLPDIELGAGERCKATTDLVVEWPRPTSCRPWRRPSIFARPSSPCRRSPKRGQPVVLCAKGVEQGSLKQMSEVLDETAPARLPGRAVSGPSFAGEVARGLPTAITLACPNEDRARPWPRPQGDPTFRPYWSSDIVGAEASWRGGEERPGHRLRHRRGPWPGPQRPRGHHHPRVR